jgi:nitrite reductase/ring-hydroxylating ferredoxin subunit
MADGIEQLTDLCPVDAVPAKGGHYVVVDGKALAVMRDGGGEIRVMDDTCPHAGASLSAGHVDDSNCIVCPWHDWAFDVDDGRCPDNPSIGVKVYPSRVEAGRVVAQLVEV